MSNSLLTDLTRVSVDLIETHPENPRIGDVEAIARSLIKNKQFQPIVVQTSTGYIIAGNHTYMAALSLEWAEVDVAYLDVDDDEARAIMLAANKTAELGTYDEAALAKLIGKLADHEDYLLEGTGYNEDEIDAILAASLFEIPDEDPGEDLGFAASMLDKIMPGDEDDETSIVETVQEISDGVTANDHPTEFVVFRFGELRAKVPRSTYESFIRSKLKEHRGDLSLAGVSTAISLGIDSESVEPAVAHGAERWL